LGERGIGTTCLVQTVCKTRQYTALQRVYNRTNEKLLTGSDSAKIEFILLKYANSLELCMF